MEPLFLSYIPIKNIGRSQRSWHVCVNNVYTTWHLLNLFYFDIRPSGVGSFRLI